MGSVILNAGRTVEANRVSGLGGTAEVNVGIGSGTGTTAATDTALFTEFTTATWASYARGAQTPTLGTTAVANDTIRWSDTFTAPVAETVTNAGVFDAATGGNGLLKSDFAGIPLNPNDSVTLNSVLQYT